MSQQKFIDRITETKFLEEQYSLPGATFVVVYGRRRVGKTELISRFIADKGIYFLATNEGDRENIKSFQQAAGRFLKDSSIELASYPDWTSLFTTLVGLGSFRHATSQSKVVMAIDEFPYLIETNRSIASVFQKIYDTILKESNIMLILSGSSVSVMEGKVLDYTSPLYGRRTGSLDVNPLKFAYTGEFLDYDFENLCNVYFVTGGIPEYLLKLDPKVDFWTNISDKFLTKGSYLYSEAEFLLRSELREPRNYFLILKAIALGYQRLGEICSYTGLDKSMVSKYLDVMNTLRLVVPEVPFGASAKFKRRNYKIVDQYLSFWFRFVSPNRTQLESSNVIEVLAAIKRDFDMFASDQFEQLTRQLVLEGLLGKSFSTCTRWWGKNRGKQKGKDVEEIDLVAYSGLRNEMLIGECKWNNRPVSPQVIEDLIARSRTLLMMYPESSVTYVIFSKKGFTERARSLAGNNLILMDLRDIRAALIDQGKKRASWT